MRHRRERDADHSHDPLATQSYDGVMRFEVLGQLRVVAAVGAGGRGTRSEPSLGGPKQRLVLARLLAEPNRVVSLDRLVDGLWGDDPPDTARHTVQGYVSELRKAVGPLIERDGTGYRISVTRDTLDSLDFEGRVADARSHASSDASTAATELEAALGLWRGPAFDDFPEAALHAEVARLEELRLAVFEELMQVRLAAGDHAAVILQLERLTREHPYREELRALHMIALYRSGRQADALRAYQATRDVLGEDLGIMPSPRLRRLEEQILLQDPDLDPIPSSSAVVPSESRWVENPYLGLRAFRESDQVRFFGQDQLIDRLASRIMGTARFTALVGPSGSGKSSVVQAGLVPRLRRDQPDLIIALMQPGAQPYAVLEAALAQIPGLDSLAVARRLARGTGGLLECVAPIVGDGSSRLLLVVDQFEELFTMVDQAEASRFLALLAETAVAPDGHVHVLVTLRADFYDRPLVDPRMGQLFAENVVSVVALGPDQLEAAATLPARQLDITVEPRLVGRLIADVAGQPNALPLFQYALTELFDAREGSVLDLATYERIGGVRKAIARRAESLYSQLAPAEQETVRQLFLRIATVSGDIVGRRRVPASELVSLDVDVVALRAAIDAFARYRLLALDRNPATGSPTVEVAHEALLAEWHRLRDWIDQHRDDLTKQAAILVAVNEWEASGRDPGYLLTGGRLRDYERWAESTQLRLTATEHDFIAAAVAARDADAVADRQRENAQLRLRRRSRHQWLLLFGVVAVCAAVITYPLVTGGSSRESIAVVLEGRRADSAFDELVARGIESAASDFGLESVVHEPPYTDIQADVRSVADDGPSLLFGTFTMQDALLSIAADYPDTTFALIDYLLPPPAPNVVTITFAVEQGSFLVGAAAALESRTGKVGYIGANSQPFIEAFRAGFEQGVAAADPDVEIVADLIQPRTLSGDAEGGYMHADPARELATAMYNDGVDVIFVAAGGSGRGVLEAATELSRADRQLWVIGVDTDQFFDINAEQQSHLLTSMFKRIDRGVQAVVAAHVNGTLAVPSAMNVTLADGAVGYTDTGGHLQPTTVAALETFRARIIDGTITVDPVPAHESPTVVADTFVFDLRTGERTPFRDALAGGTDYAVSPDGTRVARSTCCGRHDTITVANIEGSDVRTLQSPVGSSNYAPQWSPDGTKLAYQQRNTAGLGIGNLFIEDVATGQRTQLTDFEPTDADWWWMPTTFTPDGRNVIFHLPRGPLDNSEWDVWTMPVTGGAPTLLLQDAALPSRLTNGDIMFVEPSSGPAGHRIAIADAAGHRRTLVESDDELWWPTLSPDGTRIAYEAAGTIFVADVATGATTKVVEGMVVEWLSDDTLIVVAE